MTQKQRVLAMLRAAGSFGVRSDTYLAEYIPRAAARIKELREEGYEITSEREKQFTRYTLVGVGAVGGADPKGDAFLRPPVDGCADSSEEGSRRNDPVDRGELAVDIKDRRSRRPPTPSMFDYDADWEAA